MGERSPSDPTRKQLQSPKFHKLGPVTTNPFLNFLRDYRKKKPSDRKVTDVAKEAGKAWWRLSEGERGQYRIRANQARVLKKSAAAAAAAAAAAKRKAKPQRKRRRVKKSKRRDRDNFERERN